MSQSFVRLALRAAAAQAADRSRRDLGEAPACRCAVPSKPAMLSPQLAEPLARNGFICALR